MNYHVEVRPPGALARLVLLTLLGYLVVWGLVGCSRIYEPKDWQKGEDLCAANGGIKYMWAGSPGEINFSCFNGEKITWESHE